jgi:hypothetical protein
LKNDGVAIQATISICKEISDVQSDSEFINKEKLSEEDLLLMSPVKSAVNGKPKHLKVKLGPISKISKRKFNNDAD